MWRDDRIAILCDAVKTLGWPTLAGCTRVGHSFDLRYAEKIETPLRARRSAFHCVLLLSPAAVSGNGPSKKSVSESSGRSPRHISVPADWIRAHAGARACVNERTHAGDAVHGVAEVEAARGAEASKGSERGADTIAVCGEGGTVASVLAGEVLRFQRV